MIDTTIAHETRPSTTEDVAGDLIARAVEAEFDRLKVARPALLSRIGRAENILITHLSCPEASIIRPRVRGGELVAYLVKGTGGSVYRVEPGTFSCSCPDYHRRGKGCKHGLACYTLGRVYRPASPHAAHQEVGRRCVAEPKITRHDSTIVEREHGASTSYGPATCSRCLDGLAYDEQRGEWVACERCKGTGRVLAFLYERAGRHLAECVGCGERYPYRELVSGEPRKALVILSDLDKLCVRECASGHGIL